MGQTLSHGVYLPNEGERNCYAGLASNWQILNTAVGAIAEKAPLVHTHTVSQITDFPAYGNTAGTICEGNDSRLSDARTPVAHTHTKSDVTDLFNSANTWTGNNTFTGRTSYVGIYDKFQTTAFDVRTDPESTRGGDIFRFWSGTGSTYGDYLGGMSFYQSTDGSLTLQLICFGYPQIGNSTQNRINFHSARDGTSAFYPVQNNNINLGTSTNKWKTLNGINPGALSLPNINYTEGSPDVYNVGTDLNNLTKNTTDPLHFSWTSPADGWLSIMWFLRNIDPPFNVLITSNSDDRYSKFSQAWSASSARWYLATTFPVVKNVTYYFDIDFQNTTIGVVHHAYLLPCLGNV